MELKKNLVRDNLLERNIIDPEKLFYTFWFEGVEWFAYKLFNDVMLYVSYELTSDGIGYAFTVTIKADRLRYKIEPTYYSKSFTNSTSDEWKDLSDELKDVLLSHAITDLDIYRSS